MTTPAFSIPYEKQFDPQSTRTCGAACLTMIYRAFGLETPQRLVWPLISKKNQYGKIAAFTYLITADVLNRRFAAVAMQARDPLRTLRLCRESGIQVILNHRLKADSPAGHYSVFLDIDDTHVTLHDPSYGPSRRLPHDELLDLWQPRVPDSEIVGNFLIGISAKPSEPPPCKICQTPLRRSITCPRCKNRVPLQPGELLGCMNGDCSARMWDYVCCPSCDLTWNFTVSAPQVSDASASATPTVSEPPPATALAAPAAPSSPLSPPKSTLDLTKLFTDLDAFCNQIRSIPAAASHPDVMAQLDFISASKDKLTQAVAAEEARQSAYFAKLAAVAQAVQASKEAHQKKLEELKKPLAALDGDALARALLKNLGYLS